MYWYILCVVILWRAVVALLHPDLQRPDAGKARSLEYGLALLKAGPMS